MKELEGGENYEYKYVEMNKDENKMMEDTKKRDELLGERQELARELESATMEWIMAARDNNQSGIDTAKEKRAGLIDKLRKQYWDLDPYIRARSLYDRTNVIQPGGVIDFYPQSNGTNGDANGSK